MHFPLTLCLCTQNTQSLRGANLGEILLIYKKYLIHENNFTCEIKLISDHSSSLLKHIDYQACINSRSKNFKYLHTNLMSKNLLNIPLPLCKQVPLYYPLLINKNIRQKMIAMGIFIPLLWKEVITREIKGYEWEKHLASNLVLLPLDQRYDIDDMNYLINSLTKLIS